MTKYKVGDKVRIIDERGHCHDIGKEGVVIEADREPIADLLSYRVKVGDVPQWVYPHSIEPIYETGTLAELNVREGDVVSPVYTGSTYFIYGKNYTIGDGPSIKKEGGGILYIDVPSHTFRIISRASDAPTDTLPPSFGTLPEVDQLKLQLAHARGSVIESLTYGGEWLVNDEPLWTDGGVYRIAEDV